MTVACGVCICIQSLLFGFTSSLFASSAAGGAVLFKFIMIASNASLDDVGYVGDDVKSLIVLHLSRTASTVRLDSGNEWPAVRSQRSFDTQPIIVNNQHTTGSASACALS